MDRLKIYQGNVQLYSLYYLQAEIHCLCRGSRCYFPVFVKGANLSVGDVRDFLSILYFFFCTELDCWFKASFLARRCKPVLTSFPCYCTECRWFKRERYQFLQSYTSSLTMIPSRQLSFCGAIEMVRMM